MGAHGAGRLDDAGLAEAMERAVAETVAAMEATGSPVITDGEQSKPSFATYPLAGLDALAPDGVVIPFEDGHTRQLPRLTAGPFRYTTYSGAYVTAARKHASRPVKQAVIAPSAISLIYPSGRHRRLSARRLHRRSGERMREGRPVRFRGGRRQRPDRFHRGAAVLQAGSVTGPATGLRGAQQRGPRAVLRGGTEPHRGTHLSRRRPGLHPLRRCRLRRSCCPICSQSRPAVSSYRWPVKPDRPRVLDIIARERRPGQMVFVGVTDPINPTCRERTRRSASGSWRRRSTSRTDGLGCTDDCGFSPFGDDVSTARDTAVAKIRARVEGAKLAGERLG